MELCDGDTDCKRPNKYITHYIKSEGFVLEPKKLYLGSTYEKIGSDHYVTSLIGRSSVGRLGLYLQITADLGQLGAVHNWTLEMHVVQPLRVYPFMKIGQVDFWVPSGDIQKYSGKYSKYVEPHPSELYTELGSANL